MQMENVKIAVGLRTARTALGWSQLEFANLMNVAKSTVARIETLEMSAKADFLTRALFLFQDFGVKVDLIQPDQISLVVVHAGLTEAKTRLETESLRRTDRKVNVAGEPALDARLVHPKGKGRPGA